MTTPLPPRRSRIRWILLGTLLMCAVGLAALHARYPLPYVYRVFAYRDAGFEDIHRFPARTIASSDSPGELTCAPDPRVVDLIESHPDIDTLDAFVRDSETSALLVVHDGVLVLERYGLGHDRDSLQNTFSVSKSLTSALVGLAVRDGEVELDAPITRYLPELAARDERFARITVEDLLNMRSGIRYSSKIAFPIVNQDDPLIYYHPDIESLVLERTTITSDPGTFQYNNYNPALLGVILQRTVGVPPGAYLEREIWLAMGAERAAGWTIDDHGLERMESGFHACARDLARLGLLYLHGGSVNGRQVIPRSWVETTTNLAQPLELDTFDGRRWVYRTGWWIVPRPEGRPDFCAIGRFGQFIYVSPQYRAVFVRNGPDRGQWGDRDWTELFYAVAARLGG